MRTYEIIKVEGVAGGICVGVIKTSSSDGEKERYYCGLFSFRTGCWRPLEDYNSKYFKELEEAEGHLETAASPIRHLSSFCYKECPVIIKTEQGDMLAVVKKIELSYDAINVTAHAFGNTIVVDSHMICNLQDFPEN
jgi:hypothetical protein